MQKSKLKTLYRNCLVSRFLDERLQEIFHNFVKTASDSKRTAESRLVPSAVGNELGQGTVAAFLQNEDSIIPRYRGYAALIGKGLQPERIAAEVLRKKAGTAMGLGDSSGLHDLKLNICGYSSVLGSNFSVAVGRAFAKKILNESGIVVQFFGDGEASRVTFASALNLASLWRLPLLFVCENNGVSIHSDISEMSSENRLSNLASAYGIKTGVAAEREPLALFELAERAVLLVRRERAPFFLEIIGKRFVPQSLRYELQPFLGADIPKGEDPLTLFAKELEKLGASKNELASLRLDAEQIVIAAIEKAHAANPLTREEFLSIYSE